MIECICPVCGRSFIPAPQHALKDNKGFYCKPTCFIHRDDKRVAKNVKGKRVIMCDMDGETLRIFESASSAESFIGGANEIRIACREHKPYKGFLWRYEELDNDK